MREVFCSLMMVLLNALCISSICLRYLSNRNVKITIIHMVHLIQEYYIHVQYINNIPIRKERSSWYKSYGQYFIGNYR